MESPSGDHSTTLKPSIPSVPGSRRGSGSARSRIESPPFCTHRRRSPSGEIEIGKTPLPHATVMWKALPATSGPTTPSGRSGVTTSQATPATTSPATKASAWPFARTGTSPESAASASPARTTRASPTSRSRTRGSFCRQRRSRRRTSAGTAAGSSDQSGSRSTIAARTSVSDSPAKTRRPVRHSYITHPKAQMSVRRSTGLPRACSGDM